MAAGRSLLHDTPLRDEEALLQGHWLESSDGPAADEVEQRIRWLIAHALDALGSSTDGWDWLFRDSRDGRLWELTFPHGSLHGSGPRRLAVMAYEKAAEKYALRRPPETDDQPSTAS